MSDHGRRGRSRPDSKQMWDESDRRSRHPRDRRDDRDRPRGGDRRDRDRRYRSRSRSPWRSWDRRDRDRDGDRNRQRQRDSHRERDDARARDRPRASRQDHDRRERGGSRPADEGRQPAGAATPRGPARAGDARRSASPARSPSGPPGRPELDSPLPTRSRKDWTEAASSGTSLSFKVGKHDGDPPNGEKRRTQSFDRRDTSDDASRPAGGNSHFAAEDPKSMPSRDGDAVEDDDAMVVEDDGLDDMQAMMGFGGFGTTKGAKIPGNNVGAVRKVKRTEYRQYMNRVGGFNRPLSPTR